MSVDRCGAVLLWEILVSREWAVLSTYIRKDLNFCSLRMNEPTHGQAQIC